MKSLRLVGLFIGLGVVLTAQTVHLGQHVYTSTEGPLNIGFKSFLYFKNPGFEKGDVIAIKFFDKTDAEIWGACAVQLGDIQK